MASTLDLWQGCHTYDMIAATKAAAAALVAVDCRIHQADLQGQGSGSLR